MLFPAKSKNFFLGKVKKQKHKCFWGLFCPFVTPIPRKLNEACTDRQRYAEIIGQIFIIYKNHRKIFLFFLKKQHRMDFFHSVSWKH